MARNNNNTNLEQSLWAAADKLRNNMDAAEYRRRSSGIKVENQQNLCY
jgi:type I restriction-modification system DNA methylase subunit